MQNALNEFCSRADDRDLRAMCMTLELVCKRLGLYMFQSCEYYTRGDDIVDCLRDHALVLANTTYVQNVVALLTLRVAYSCVSVAKIKTYCTQLSASYALAVSQTLCYIYNIYYSDNIKDNFNAVLCVDLPHVQNNSHTIDFIID